MNFVCVHSHFYQPPRENPFTGVIPQEPGAEPYHDWNQRIDDECYRPNAKLGNFELIGFDLGPTLASWLEKNDPVTYQAFIAADQRNLAEHGFGNAIAQAYNHTILPLASPREKTIQVAWGIADFEHRYARKPDGMWLPETAVDIPTLETLAEFAISYTILAPWQAREPCVDVTEPYIVNLPSGKQITVLFFDSQTAKHISWSPRISRDAWEFAELCLPMRSSWFKERHHEDQLLLIAADGEYFGHHHRGRERFLNTLMAAAAPNRGYTPTYPALYLSTHRAKQEIKIIESTAWSCYHGISRWKETCPCIPGDGSWKGHLRRALNRLAERVDALFDAEVSRALSSTVASSGKRRTRPPKGSRNDELLSLLQGFIEVALGKINGLEYVRRNISASLDSGAQARILDLLWAQYYRQLMFTSCGFFFEDLSRIEPKNDIAYAAKAIELIRRSTGNDLEPEFLVDLARAKSTITRQTGTMIYRELVSDRA